MRTKRGATAYLSAEGKTERVGKKCAKEPSRSGNKREVVYCDATMVKVPPLARAVLGLIGLNAKIYLFLFVSTNSSICRSTSSGDLL